MKGKTFIEKIKQWDRNIVLKFNGLGGKSFTYFLKVISFFGRETFWFFLLAIYLFIWYDLVPFVYIGATFMNGLILILIVKETVKRERPFETIKEIKILEPKPSSKSFPSWHAYNVASQSLIFGFLLNSWLVTLTLLIFAALVAFSRIQLGVHYPSDVIVGFLIGVLGFLLTFYLWAPLFITTILFLEQFAIHDIYFRQINPMLYDIESIWYLILSIIVFVLIFFTATYRMFREKREIKKE